MKIHDWSPDKGDALQGDVCLFRVRDSVKIDLSDEITPRDGRLILAEGEITGHHHAIWMRNPPVSFRDDGAGSGVSATDTAAMIATATKTNVGTAKLYRDPNAVAALMRCGELTTDALAIGFLVVEGKSTVLRHDEHDAIRIPPGRYYVGGQAEFDAASMRRVAD